MGAFLGRRRMLAVSWIQWMELVAFQEPQNSEGEGEGDGDDDEPRTPHGNRGGPQRAVRWSALVREVKDSDVAAGRDSPVLEGEDELERGRSRHRR